MLDFQRRRRPRHSPIGGQPRRLLYLVAALALVLILMRAARNPGNYRWLTSSGTNQSLPPAEAASVTPKSGKIDTNDAPGTFVTTPGDRSTGGVEAEYFAGVDAAVLDAIRDGEPFRASEFPAWLHLLGILRQAGEAELEHASTGRVSYVELSGLPRDYRGKLVTIRGTARRVDRAAAPKNDLGITDYYQVWIRPEDNDRSPIVVHCLRLPPGFNAGADVKEEVEATGFFFKRCAYLGQQAMEIAPTAIAQMVRRVGAAEPKTGRKETGLARNPAQDIRPLTPNPSPARGEGSSGAASPVAASPARGEESHGAGSLARGGRKNGTAAARDEQSSLRSARDFFALQGIDQGQLGKFVDGRPWAAAETELMLKILYRLGQSFQPWDMERWCLGRADIAEWLRNPAGYRGEVVRITGRAVRADVVELAPDEADRYEMRRYYRCQVRLEGGQATVVLARRIPSQWKTDTLLDEPVGAYGVLLKLEPGAHGEQRPVLAAPRLAWYPPSRLGKLGMDMGLLDDLRMPAFPNAESEGDSQHPSLNEFHLRGNDRECFYQMLAAVGRSGPGELLREAERDSSDAHSSPVVPLFNRPAEQQGRLFALSGTVRRVVRVPVADPEIVSRFGIRYFYQLYLFTAESEGNPLVFCLRELPTGMPIGDGPLYGEEATLAGFFFKTWAYRIDLPGESPPRRSPWQLAPLLIGRDAVWHPAVPPSGHRSFGLWMGGLVVAGGLAIWAVLWWVARKDRQFEQRTLARQLTMNSGESLAHLETEESRAVGNKSEKDSLDS